MPKCIYDNAIGHKSGDKMRRLYQRGGAFEKRRKTVDH
jgi:hypothetical protein